MLFIFVIRHFIFSKKKIYIGIKVFFYLLCEGMPGEKGERGSPGNGIRGQRGPNGPPGNTVISFSLQPI